MSEDNILPYIKPSKEGHSPSGDGWLHEDVMDNECIYCGREPKKCICHKNENTY